MRGHNAISLLKVIVPEEGASAFAAWRGQFYHAISQCEGWVSLEIASIREENGVMWNLVQRFRQPRYLQRWQHSPEYEALRKALEVQLSDQVIEERDGTRIHDEHGAMEVLEVHLLPGGEEAYRNWVTHLHEQVDKVEGLQGLDTHLLDTGVAPTQVVVLQFEHPKQLKQWLASSSHAQCLRDIPTFAASWAGHRMLSNQLGWLSFATPPGEAPLWKQTLLILLLLFPIVMLEILFLSPQLSWMPLACATFIANALSVSLLSWPLIPFAFKWFSWWLFPSQHKKGGITLAGLALLGVLYAVELWIFSL